MTATVRFSGFPQQGIDFLTTLASHNERAWFEAHKSDYQSYLLEPTIAFVSELGSKLQAISSEIRTDLRSDGSGVLMRIHRDTRFSKDKSPYKTNIGGLFWQGTKKTESPAFGFQLEATGMGLMAGIFKFPPELLMAYRNAVLSERSGRELEEVLERVRKTGNYAIGGEHYKRVPAGFDPNHKRSDLLRYEGLHVFAPLIAIDAVQSPALVDICYEHFQEMAPIFSWLVKGVKISS